ncbi:amidohydrolase [Pedococcus sp. 5OH_020]|uniref:amidohydrolase n=1 Tax=Pedococcus sp. 5OH_020 TaxID=2989814 RepID=UPI0022E9B95C|nr:amidohydrolase family protein [Pedococcus sp. 5OH_020]
MSTLYRGGFVYSPVDPFANALVVDDATGTIAWIGGDDAASGHVDAVDEVVELDGALVTPAFVDAHAHVSQTGAGLRGVDLGETRSVAEALSRIEDGARAHQGRPVYAPNWDQGRWAEGRPHTAGELDRATYGGVVYSPRVDGHSAVISSALASASGARDLPGWEGDGLVTRDAHHAAREAFTGAVTPAQRRADIDLALHTAAAAGIGLVHENGGRTLSGTDDFAEVLAAGQRGDAPQTIGYWAQLVSDEAQARDVATVRGARGLAGDLNVDGSIGSRTAHLRAPYADREGHTGNGYLSVAEVRDHVTACSLAGLQAGFHVIGDAGVDTVVQGFEAAAAMVGVPVVTRARHRLEHVEMISTEGIARLVALGVTASVQPAFDALWGGDDGMYAERLGSERVSGMNPFASMMAAGMTLALGSDSPVTPFAPWEAVRACVNHHDPEQRVSARSAFLAHTRGGWRAAGYDDRGYLDLGLPATIAVWEVGDLVVQAPDDRIQTWSTDPRSGTPGLPDLSPGSPTPKCLRTVVRGRTVFDAGALDVHRP